MKEGEEKEQTGVKDENYFKELAIKDKQLFFDAMRQNPKLSFKQVEHIIDSWEEWAGSFTKCVEVLRQHPEIDNPEALCAWLHHEAEGIYPAEKFSEEDAVSFYAPFVSKNNAERLVTAPVLVAGEPDSDGEVVSPEQIRRVATEFMEKYRLVDVAHSFNAVGVPIESWILRKSEKINDIELPAGSWLMTVKVTDDKVWQGILSDQYVGLSITAVPSVATLEARKGANSTGIRRVRLQDLGDNWRVVSVSIVKNPAVFKSKWLAIKTDTPSLWTRLKNKLSHKEDTGMNENEIQALINKALEGLTQRLQKLEQALTELQASIASSRQRETDKQEETPVAVKAQSLSKHLQRLRDALLEAYERGDKEAIKNLRNRIAVVQELLSVDDASATVTTTTPLPANGETATASTATDDIPVTMPSSTDSAQTAIASKSRAITDADSRVGQSSDRDIFGRRIKH